MNKKTIIILCSILGAIALCCATVFITIAVMNHNKEVTIQFDVDGGVAVPDLKVKKGKTATLPSTTKENHLFEGWYFNDKEITSTYHFNKDITVKAKWKEITEEVKTFKVVYDSKGGSAVSETTVECEKPLTLPANPTRSGYTFDGWEDSNGKVILNGALLTCEDVTLTAKWVKNEEPKKEETKKEEPKKEETPKEEPKKEYTCPDGYTLNGVKCSIEGTVHEKCPTDTTADGSLCIRTTDSNEGERVCKEYTVSIDGKGHTWTGGGDYYYIPNAYGNCAYYKWTDYTTKEQCENANDTYHKTKWVSYLNGCYAETKMNNYETVCSSDYQFYSSSELSSKFGIHNNGRCLKKVAKTKYCDEGYTLTSGKCIKTIDATVK